jgi:hypothetical protein
MPEDDPLDPSTDPFHPPAIPTLVGCLHCGQAYESYQIEWRVETDADGKPHGFWCCPVTGCSGRGFGFDILPLDPHYRDERGGWIQDDEGTEDEDGNPDEAPDSESGSERRPGDGDEQSLPW